MARKNRNGSRRQDEARALLRQVGVDGCSPVSAEPQAAKEHLDSERRDELHGLLVRCRDVFAGPDGKLGRASVVRHRVGAATTEPVKVNPRRMGWARRDIVSQHIDGMLEQGVVEHAE